MGVGYYKSLVQWSRGEYLSANNKEDDLAIITTSNGFTYRSDLQPSTPIGAPTLTVKETTVSDSGIIETGADADTFAFTTTGGIVSITVLGDAASQNLDVLAEILDAGGNVLASSNPDTYTDATVVKSLTAGRYNLRVSGVSRGNPLAGGYVDYGSLGQYTVAVAVPVSLGSYYGQLVSAAYGGGGKVVVNGAILGTNETLQAVYLGTDLNGNDRMRTERFTDPNLVDT